MAGTKTTKVDLVKELTELNVNGKYNAIINRAKNNGYHDFKFEDVPNHPEYGDCICPKAQLVEDLSKFPELNQIRDAVINGQFDESPDEPDKDIMRGWLKNDGESGERMIKVLGLD